jgi:two-component system sensor histidine kinase/response regulator
VPPVPAPAPETAPAPEAATLQARIEAIPGLAVAQGLRFSAGRWPLYARLLGMLVQDHGDDIARLRDRLAAGDTESAARIAHSLKGAGATLGAEKLRERAAALETAIYALPAGAAAIEALCLALGEELGCLVTAIRDLDIQATAGPSVS